MGLHTRYSTSPGRNLQMQNPECKQRPGISLVLEIANVTPSVGNHQALQLNGRSVNALGESMPTFMARKQFSTFSLAYLSHGYRGVGMAGVWEGRGAW